MGCGRTSVIVAVLGLTACFNQTASRYNEPPASTYTIATRQLKTDDGITPVSAAAVTSEFFRATGIDPFLGRFLIDVDQTGPAAAAVLSHDLWKERFGSSPQTIGRQIDLDERRFTVVGIAPPGFTFPGATRVWTAVGVGGK